VVIGENHGVGRHRDQQLEILSALRGAGHRVSVGLEFFPRRFQPEVDGWRAGRLAEAEFLKRIGWGGTSFDFYRPQALFPDLAGGSKTLALNADGALTKRVAKVGLAGLTDDERAELPPGFETGNANYRDRFARQMPHLPDPAALDRYFAAQSVWDDTMAWTAARFHAEHPEQTLVIVVGDFHVQYGGGLPDRLRARGVPAVVTVSQFNVHGLDEGEVLAGGGPDPRDGARADAVWIEDVP